MKARTAAEEANPYIGFDQEFLRWMLSDGASSAVVQDRWAKDPNYRVAYDQLLAGPTTPATTGPVIGDFLGVRAAVVDGPGHYLGSAQTLELMQTEYIYPAIGDRLSPKEWAEVGRPKVLDRAIAKVQEVLGSHFPTHIPDEIDDLIRAELPIRLDRSKMRPPAP